MLVAKQKSWLLTGIAAAVMTVGSVPFMLDWVTSGFDVSRIQRREPLAQALACFFVAYLGTVSLLFQKGICRSCVADTLFNATQDLTLGVLHYNSDVSLLTGWTHHLAYQVLLYFVLHQGAAHVFCMAAVMELPTVALASAFLFPQLRCDELFLGLFFVTRICLHAVLMALFSTPHGIEFGTSTYTLSGQAVPSYTPIIGLCLAAPLHLSWFSSSLRGYLKRRHTQPPSPLLKPFRAARPKLLRLASSLSNLPLSAFLLSSSVAGLDSPPLPRSASTDTAGPFSTHGPSWLRARLEEEMASFFRTQGTDWRQRDQGDVLKAFAPLGQVRMRAGSRGDRVRRLFQGGVRGWQQGAAAGY